MARSLTGGEDKKKPKLGSGRRFHTLESALSHERGIDNPRALAAAIGRKKFGGEKMGKMSAASRARHDK